MFPTLLLVGCTSTSDRISVRDDVGYALALVVESPVIKAEVATPYMRYRSGPNVMERLQGAGEQALKDAKEGASLGQVWLGSGCRGKRCLGGLALALVTSAAGGTIGTVMGSVSGAMAGHVETSDVIAALVDAVEIPQELGRRLMSSARESKPKRHRFEQLEAHPQYMQPIYLREQDIDSLLLVQLNRVALLGTDNEGPHQLVIDLDLSLFAVPKKTIVARGIPVNPPLKLRDMRGWEYRSRGRTLQEWLRDDGKPLAEELEEFYKDMQGRFIAYLGLTR